MPIITSTVFCVFTIRFMLKQPLICSSISGYIVYCKMRSILIFIFILSFISILSCRPKSDQKKNIEKAVNENFSSSHLCRIQFKDTAYFKTCSAIETDSSLNLIADLGDNELHIIKKGSQFQCKYIPIGTPSDSTYKPPTVRTLSQEITLDKESYKKGSIVNGKINLTFKTFYSFINTTDTVQIFGSIKTKVE
jgi:hypothetical protein